MARPKAIRRTVQLRIMLLDFMPHVWRQVLVPETITLPKLHGVILYAVGWQGGHLHEFEFGPIRFSEPDEEWPDEQLRDERRIKLSQAMGDVNRHFEHRYDFGDNWRHFVVVEDLFKPDEPLKQVQCIGGQNACPPEDVGGAYAYQEFLQAIADPTHEDHDSYRQWIGRHFDPTEFSLDDTNAALSDIKI